VVDAHVAEVLAVGRLEFRAHAGVEARGALAAGVEEATQGRVAEALLKRVKRG
jgi:hypothetical protein